MTVIERYILRRTAGIFIATLLWVLAIVWTTQVLVRIDVVTSNGQSAATFFQIAWLVLPSVIPIVIPFAIGIAVAQTLTAMNTDSELVVINAAGSPRMAVIRPMLVLAIIAALICLVIANVISPPARQQMRTLLSESRANLITSVIEEGMFQKIEDGLYIQIGERLPDGRFGSIFVADTREKGTELIYFAKEGMTAEIDGIQLLVMQDGSVQRKTNGNISVVRYSSYAFDMSQFTAAGARPNFGPKDRDLSYLLQPDANDWIQKSNPLVYRAEIHKRFSEWLYPLVFALIGLAVAGDSRSFREARIHPLLTAMSIALLFRWAGFFFVEKIETSPAYIPVVYLVPFIACAIAIFFIATNRVMELPMWLVERALALLGRLQGLWQALRRRSRPGLDDTAPGGAP